MMKRNSKGFTLIELMIVVAIIGILAAVAVPKFADLVTKSKEASVKGSLGSVRSALSIYYGDTEGVYPTDLHAALTTGNKYMPAVGNVNSLGRFEIPQNSNGNPGHTSGFYANASSGSVLNDDAGTIDPNESGGQSLVYGTLNSSGHGEVYVNCTHDDTKGLGWSTY